MPIPIELRSEKKLQTSRNLTLFSKVSLPAHSLLAFHPTSSLFHFNLPFQEKKPPFCFFFINLLLRAQLVFSSSIVLPEIFCPFKPTILVTSTLVHLLEYITAMIISAALIAPVIIVCMTSLI